MKRNQPDEADPLADAAAAEIEQLLRRMPLARPSRRLDERVRLALVPRGPAGWFAVGALSAAAAAAAVIVVGLPLLHGGHDRVSALSTSPQGAPISPVVSSVVSSNELPARLRVESDAGRVDDAGIVGRVDGVPLHGYHVRRVRQIWYYDAQRDTRLSVTVPVDQVVVVPVQTF